MGSASSGGFYRQPGAMASKRTLLSVTMTAEEWHHVLGVLRAGAKHLEPAADAVADTFSDAYSRALLVLSAAETMEILEDLVASDNDPRR